MCGLILAGGNLTSSDMDIVERMLIIDMFRGDHSTGVFSKFFPLGKDPVFKMVKAALAGDEFVRSQYWYDAAVIESRTPSTMQPGTDIVSRIFPKALFGHNRYATKGAVNATNAHPFQHGHITLAHNGTLIDQTLLPEHHRFAVDSDNVAYAMSVWGVEKTIKNLHGSFTLIWHDANEQTINIIRNEDREFHLAETTGGDWFGMSEEWMLMGLLGRGRHPKRIKRHFELTPGVQYIFDVSSGFKFKEERKHELPTFRSYSAAGNRSKWYDSYSSSTPSTGKTGTTQAIGEASTKMGVGYDRYNAMLDKHGLTDIAIGSIIKAEFFQHTPYTTNPSKGLMVGWLPECGDYVEVQVHAVDSNVFGGTDIEKYIEIRSCYEINGMLTIIAALTAAPVFDFPSVINSEHDEILDLLEEVAQEAMEESSSPFLGDEYDQEDPDLPEEEEFTASGDRFTREQWKRSQHNTCSQCSSPIPFEDIQGAYIMDSPSACFCEECYVDIREAVREEQLREEEAQRPVEMFCCALCTTDYPVALMSEEREHVCKECHTHYYGTSAGRVQLGNGMLVNQRIWEKMNGCHYCRKPIPWSYAALAKFKFDNPVCKSCEMRYPEKK